MQNAVSIDDDGGHGGIRFGGGAQVVVDGLFAPSERAGSHIETGEHAPHPKCANPALSRYWRAAWSRMPRRRTGDHAACGILRLPDNLATARVEAKEHLIGVLPAEGVELLSRQYRGGVALADRDLPFLRQIRGPGRGRIEPGNSSIPIGPAPLRPVLGEEGVSNEQSGRSHRQSDPLRKSHIKFKPSAIAPRHYGIA